MTSPDQPQNQTPKGLSEITKGLLALGGTFTLWGVSMLYYDAMRHVPAFEVLAHRSLWTFVIFGGWIALQGRLGELGALLKPSNPDKMLQKIVLASFFVSINWFIFIFAVQTGRSVEASLAYYIHPLMAAAAGVVIFKEQLFRAQYMAMILAVVAVLILTFGLKTAPVISLMMAGTFVIYGVIKKRLDVGPVLSMAAESLLLVPFALVYLFGAQLWGWGGTADQPAGAFGRTLYDSLGLIFSGVVTGVPLILFAYGSRRVSLTVAGLGNYWNSTIQLIIATLVFGLPLTIWHKIALPMIWIAIVIYTFEAFTKERRSRRTARR